MNNETEIKIVLLKLLASVIGMLMIGISAIAFGAGKIETLRFILFWVCGFMLYNVGTGINHTESITED